MREKKMRHKNVWVENAGKKMREKDLPLTEINKFCLSQTCPRFDTGSAIGSVRLSVRAFVFILYILLHSLCCFHVMSNAHYACCVAALVLRGCKLA